ncbi:Mov34/MPN/PAD-1 family protein [Novosphingobium pokkalii]|nr:Mov34/MPN/PAD-1 family protein [Novosphingobium pokkalii]GHC82481.1 hypothetical protein GCM10019060_01140 [Novosphingobium pokkalii]
MAFHAYLLLCADGSFYAGHTDDLDTRMAQHESGLGGYTAQRRPLRLVWQQDFATREEALSAELRIKGWSRAKKQALVDGDWERLQVLARNRQGREVARGGFDKLSPNGTAGEDQSEDPSPALPLHPPFALSLSEGAGAAPGITITANAQATMLAAAHRAHPREACGLLLGEANHIALAQECTNVAPDPLHHFEIDPVALIAAHRAARAGAPQVLGYFHSHPNGLTRPSATDSAQAAGDRRTWAIVAQGKVTIWRDTPSVFQALSYRVTDG